MNVHAVETLPRREPAGVTIFLSLVEARRLGAYDDLLLRQLAERVRMELFDHDPDPVAA